MNTFCPHCKRSMKPAKHELHAGLVDALRILFERVQEKKARGERFWNEVHIRKELNLTRDQWSNFSKLKWLGLVIQQDRYGKPLKRGYWAITKAGDEFIRGHRQVRSIVYTFNKKRVKWDGAYVSAREFLKDLPNWKIDEPVQVERQTAIFTNH